MGAGVVIGLCLSGEGEECVRDAASVSECNSAERYGKCGDDARAHHDGLCGDAARVEQLHDHNLQRLVDEVEVDRVTADVLQEAGHGGFLASVERASDAPREEHGSRDSGEDDGHPDQLEALDGPSSFVPGESPPPSAKPCSCSTRSAANTELPMSSTTMVGAVSKRRSACRCCEMR